MAQIKKNAGNVAPGDFIYVVTEKRMFPHSSVMKAEIIVREISNIGFGIGGDKEVRIINGEHTVKVEGKIQPGIDDIVYDPEIAKEIWGISMENTIKQAEKNLVEAQNDLKAAKNYRDVTESTLSKEDLGFNKKGKVLEIVQEDSKNKN